MKGDCPQDPIRAPGNMLQIESQGGQRGRFHSYRLCSIACASTDASACSSDPVVSDLISTDEQGHAQPGITRQEVPCLDARCSLALASLFPLTFDAAWVSPALSVSSLTFFSEIRYKTNKL